MNTITQVIETPEATLSYYTIGTGIEKILCFHGYGQIKESYEPIAKVLYNRYTLYVFDIFYHGSSTWLKEEEPLKKDELKSIIEVFLKKEKIAEFSLMGFSMGCKFCLALLCYFAPVVKKMYLIAPDGISENFWYKMATSTMVGRKVFKAMVFNPGLISFFAKVLTSIKVIPQRVVNFAQSQLILREQQERVYYSWTTFRLLHSPPKDLIDRINYHGIKVHVFLGEHDRVITYKHIKFFVDNLNSCKLYTLKSGHTHLLDATAEFFKNNDI